MSIIGKNSSGAKSIQSCFKTSRNSDTSCNKNAENVSEVLCYDENIGANSVD